MSDSEIILSDSSSDWSIELKKRKSNIKGKVKTPAKTKKSERATAMRSSTRKRTNKSYAESSGSDNDDSEVISLQSSSLSSDIESDWGTAKTKPKKKQITKPKKETAKSKNKGNAAGTKRKKSSKASSKKLGFTNNVEQTEKAVPKIKKKKLKVDEEAHKAQAEAVKKSTERGLLSNLAEKISKNQGNILPPNLLRCNMTELSVKKKSRKEQRYMFVFPGKLAVLNAGTCGTLEDVSTNSPKLNIDFNNPDEDSKSTVYNRLRLIGNIVYPKNDYLTINCKANGKEVICEDTFDHIVIFHSYEWMKVTDGKAESCGEIHSAVDSEAKAEVEKINWDDPPVLGLTHNVDAQESSDSEESSEEKDVNKVTKSEASDDDDSIEIQEDKGSDAEFKSEKSEIKNLPKRATPSRRATKKIKYAESSSSDDSIELLSD